MGTGILRKLTLSTLMLLTVWSEQRVAIWQCGSCLRMQVDEWCVGKHRARNLHFLVVKVLVDIRTLRGRDAVRCGARDASSELQRNDNSVLVKIQHWLGSRAVV